MKEFLLFLNETFDNRTNFIPFIYSLFHEIGHKQSTLDVGP